MGSPARPPCRPGPARGPARARCVRHRSRCSRRRWPGDDAGAERFVEGQLAEQLRRELEILRLEQDPGAAERVRNRRRGISQHGHVRRHRFEQRHTEAFVLRQREVDARRVVVDRQLLVGHRTGKDETIRGHLELGNERPHHVEVARHAVGLADEDEPVALVHVALVELGQPDEVFDLLVRRDAADEQEVLQPVIEDGFEGRPSDRRGDPREIHGNGEDAGVREPEPLELLAVVFRVAERQVGVAHERLRGPRG